MIITRNWLEAVLPDRPKVVMTIGVFDGLHLGHQHLIKETLRRAAALKAESLVLTFEPHPMAVLSPGSDPEILTTFRQKTSFLEEMGLDRLGCLVFDEELRGLSPQSFLSQAILKQVEPLEIVIGPDFRFGRNAEGHLGMLKDWGKINKAVITPAELQAGRDELSYSSSHIRSLLKIGLVDSAALSLGRPYRLSGEVVTGAARGRALGFPTANLGAAQQLIPGPGVYAVKAFLRGQTLNGMTSIGHNPTFGSKSLTVETFIFDFNDDCYGEALEIDFIAHLRGMVRFEGPGKLVEQLKADEKAARAVLT